MKTAIPTDYEQKYTLSEVDQLFGSWANTIKRIVEIKGFYTCMYDNKKTLIVKS
jgi:hypothetical protein